MTTRISILLLMLACAVYAADRYVDNGDGTVTDSATSLMWMKDANLAGQLSYSDATNYCATLVITNINGAVTNIYDDWRMPSVYIGGALPGETNELNTLGRYQGNPTNAWEGFAGSPFINVQAAEYGSVVIDVGGDVWYHVSMVNGDVQGVPLTANQAYVWPVRGTNAPLGPITTVLIVGGTSVGNVSGSGAGAIKGTTKDDY